MNQLKMVFLLAFTVFFACKNTSTTNASQVKEAPTTTAVAKKMEMPPPSEPAMAKEVAIKEEEPAMTKEAITPIKEVSTEPTSKPVNKAKVETSLSEKAKKNIAQKKETVANAVSSTKEKAASTINKAKKTTDKVVEAVKETKITTAAIKEKPSPPKVIEVANTAAASTPKKVVNTAKEEVATIKKEVIAVKKGLDHALWDGILRKYVSAKGKVNYKGIKADKNFAAYLQLLKANPVKKDWPRNKQLAHWINVYNAFTIKLITDNYPIASITKLNGGKPWDQKWIKLGDKTYSLNEIENEIIRPQFKDARIHFAVNCAAASCPPILNRAWTASNLNSNLERQTKLFINNTAFNTIGEKGIKVSKIFDWYKEDFGDLITYINKYADTSVKSDATINFNEYDWALNE